MEEILLKMQRKLFLNLPQIDQIRDEITTRSVLTSRIVRLLEVSSLSTNSNQVWWIEVPNIRPTSVPIVFATSASRQPSAIFPSASTSRPNLGPSTRSNETIRREARFARVKSRPHQPLSELQWETAHERNWWPCQISLGNPKLSKWTYSNKGTHRAEELYLQLSSSKQCSPRQLLPNRWWCRITHSALERKQMLKGRKSTLRGWW